MYNTVISFYHEIYNLLDLPYPQISSLKQIKKDIITKLGFTKVTDGLNVRKDFYLSDNPQSRLELFQYCKRLLEENHCISIRFVDENGLKSGGYPTTYLLDIDDLDSHVKRADDEILGFITTTGSVFRQFRNVVANVFSRRKSFGTLAKGFDNNEETLFTRLGGGFRIQLDDVIHTNSGWVFGFSALFIFNDIGLRLPSSSVYSSHTFPYFSATFIANSYNDKFAFNGSFIPTAENLEAVEIETVVFYILRRFFESEGGAIFRLFSILLRIYPFSQLYSLEALFSLGTSCQDLIGPEVFDFDGIDTVVDWVNRIESMKSEHIIVKQRLFKAKWELFSLEKENTSLVSCLENIQKMEQSMREVLKSNEIPQPVKYLIVQHITNYTLSPNYPQVLGFTLNRTHQVILARLLKNIPGIEWLSTNTPSIRIALIDDNKFIEVNIQGYELVFWIKDRKLVVVNSVKDLIIELSQCTGWEILPVHYSYTFEGG